jgi:hypothetical protein
MRFQTSEVPSRPEAWESPFTDNGVDFPSSLSGFSFGGKYFFPVLPEGSVGFLLHPEFPSVFLDQEYFLGYHPSSSF